VYEEFDGDHQWNYWRAHIGKSFKFFASQLKQVMA
jgi:enterochelin esterase-like enzyme